MAARGEQLAFGTSGVGCCWRKLQTMIGGEDSVEDD